MSKISQLPALTGANLANGDLFPVVDVGSPNQTEYITADELAQGSQFSSRFVPKSGDTLFVPASAMTTGQSSPSIKVSWGGGWALDQSTNEYVACSVELPGWWNTYHVDMVWYNDGAGSGDVRLTYSSVTQADGNDRSVGNLGFNSVDVTAAAQNIVEHSRIVTSSTFGLGNVIGILTGRAGNVAEDTLGNDIVFLGVRYVRAS
jgi:hypothetical protein